MESFLCGHVWAFQALGGVPRQLLYDNLKSAVLERVGEHIRYHPRLLELCGHYHFTPRPCAPYRGNEKGKVERTIRFLRSSFFAAREYKDLDDLNAQLQTWIQSVAHQRDVPQDPQRRCVADVWAEEKAHLLPLPAHPFETAQVRAVRAKKWPYVRFDLNDYSIPHEQVENMLTLIATQDRVRIVDDHGTCLADHRRVYDRGQCIEDRRHIDALAQQKRRASELRGRTRLCQVCTHATALLQAIAQRGHPLRSQTNALLNLLDR